MSPAQIIENMDIEEYHDHPAVSASSLKLLLKCPEAYRYEMLDPAREEERREEKKHFVIGTAFHTLCLERGLFDQRFYVMPPKDDGKEIVKNDKHKVYQEQIALAKGRTILKESEIADVKKMALAVARNPEAMKYIKRPGIAEVSIFWDDPDTGIQCRMRPDYLIPEDDVIVNFKSAADAEEEAFMRQIWNLGYDISIDHYAQGYYAAYGRYLRKYIFIDAEKKAPWLTAVYQASETLQVAGQMRRTKLMQIYAECLRTNTWPGLNGGKEKEISIPNWANKQLENEGVKA